MIDNLDKYNKKLNFKSFKCNTARKNNYSISFNFDKPKTSKIIIEEKKETKNILPKIEEPSPRL